MNKKKYFLFLTLSLLLTACGGGNNETSSSSLESSASTSETTSLSNLETEIQEKLGTRAALKSHLESLSDDLKSYKKESTENNSYGYRETFSSISIANNEVYEIISNSSESAELNENITDYYALIDGVRYAIYENDTYKEYSSAERVVCSNEALQEEQVLLNEIIESKSLKGFLNDTSTGWGHLFNESYVVTTYRTTLNDFDISVRIKLAGQAIEYMFVSTFDLDFNFIEGTMTKSGYSYSNWDNENHVPLANAEPSYVQTYKILDLEYGRDDVTTPSLDMNGFFIYELVGEAKIYSSDVDPDTLKEVRSDANKLFINSYINTNNILGEDLTYLPETAYDVDTITITSSSNENAVFQNENGTWVTGNEIGAKSTLTLGNSFNPNMKSVEVTLVEFSVPDDQGGTTPTPKPGKLPEADSILLYFIAVADYKTGNTTYIEKETFNIELGTNDSYGFPTTSAGPFGGLDGFTFEYSNEGVVSFKVSDLNSNYGSFPTWNVYFDIEALSLGTTTVDIKLNGNKMWKVTITVIEPVQEA